MLYDDAVAERALSLLEPAIKAMLAEEGLLKRPDLAVRVGRVLPRPDEVGLHYEFFATRDFGDRETWEHEFGVIAEGKLELSARTGLPSRIVHLFYPELLLPSDVLYWGSWIDGDVVAACSGVEPYMDEAISKMIVNFIKALLEHDKNRLIARREEESPNGIYFTGHLPRIVH